MTLSHREAQDSLAAHIRTVYDNKPLVFTEVALSGRNGDAGRFDAVAVWTTGQYRNHLVHGYEVKVTRSDLLRDLSAGKYRKYLTQVDRLFFAFPDDIAAVGEIPPEVGVILWNGISWRQVRAAKKLKRIEEVSLPWRLLWRAHSEVEQERVERRRLQQILRARARKA